MPSFEPQPSETLRDARQHYFDANQFGPNGGYDDPWVMIKFGPITVPIRNTKGRIRAVRFHDLHHILTGYTTDLRGEAEIAAWEIGSGCADHYAAWVLNLGAMSYGNILIPRRMWRAFLRGRKSKNLYRETFDEALLDRQVGEMRAALNIDHADAERAEAADIGLYAATIVASVMTGTAFGLLTPPISVYLFLSKAAHALDKSEKQTAT